MLSAEDLHRRGLSASSAGRFGEARAQFGRALARSTSADLTSQIEISLAYVHAETGDVGEGLRLCHEALARRGVSERTRGIARSQRGLLFMRRGQVAKALADFSAAVAVVGDEPEYGARAYLNRGNVHLQRGDAARAELDFRASAERATTDVARARARHNLGYTHLLRGDLVSALRLMEEAFDTLAGLSPVYRAVVSQDRAEAMIAAGLYSEGLALLQESVRVCGARRLRQFQGEAGLALARAMLMTDPPSARAAAGRASRVFRSHGSESWALRAEAVRLQASVASGGRSARLVGEADDLADRLGAERLLRDATLARLMASRVLVRRGSWEDAAARLRRLRITPASPISARLAWHEISADLARAQQRPETAFSHIRAGLEELQAWQSSFGSLDLQSGVVGHGRQLAVDGLRMAVADGRPDVVFEWSERARGLASRITPVRAPADPTLREELSELRLLQALDPDPRSREGRRITALREAVREHAWSGGSGEVAAPLTLAELQEILLPDQALVAYVTVADRLTALVVLDEAAHVVDLGPRDGVETLLGGLFPDLDMAGSDLPMPFASSVRAELVARLDHLSALLVRPLSRLLADRSVVLTPSGLLAGVPWGLLPGFHRRPLSVARSATAWHLRRSPEVRHATAGFVAGPRVARATAEVAAAAELWPGSSVLTGESATSTAVSELASRVDVLHVSAHGRHSSENPLFSGVELVDGPWFGYDIDQLAGVPDVVLLSACEVGRSQVRYGEELIGMTAAWQHAGVRSVIASAAAVNDHVAHDVLLAVHQGLCAGLDPAAALAAALPEPGDDAPPAPFVCFA